MTRIFFTRRTREQGISHRLWPIANIGLEGSHIATVVHVVLGAVEAQQKAVGNGTTHGARRCLHDTTAIHHRGIVVPWQYLLRSSKYCRSRIRAE